MGLVKKNNTGLEEIRESVVNLENISTEIKTSVNEVKTDTEGIVLSNDSIKAIVDEIQNRIGLTDDTGGSATAGSMMSKLNQIIGTTASGGGSWEIPRIKQIITNSSATLSSLGMMANVNYKLLAFPTTVGTESTEFALNKSSSGDMYCYINDVMLPRARHFDFPIGVPFYMKVNLSDNRIGFVVNNVILFWLEDTSE